jgi:hypothetical protein
MKCLFYILTVGYCIVALACNGSLREGKKTANIGSVPAGPVKADSLAARTSGDGFGGKDSVMLTTLTDSIYKFPEVQKIDKEISVATGGKHGVSFLPTSVNDKPGIYEVMVGYNGKERFENRMIFKVNVATMEIKVIDFDSGEDMSVKEYRKLHPLKK